MGELQIGVTGADGFIGSHFISRLKKNKISHKVFIEGGDLDKFLKDVYVLVHLAGRVLPPEKLLFASNVEFTKDLLNRSLSCDIKKIIFLSTFAVHANNDSPTDIYAQTKLQAEKLVKNWGEKHAKKTIILRPFNVYGPKNKKGLVCQFYVSIKDKGIVNIFGDGSVKRDLLFVDDLVTAIYKALDVSENIDLDLLYGTELSILEVVDTFKKIMDREFDVVYKDEDLDKVKNIKHDSYQSENLLNWEARTTFEEGLKKTVSWYEKNL